MCSIFKKVWFENMEPSQDKYKLTSLHGAIIAVLIVAALTCGVVTASEGKFFLSAVVLSAAYAGQIYIDTYSGSIAAYWIPLPAVLLVRFFGVEIDYAAVIVGTVLLASMACGYAYSVRADAFRTTALSAAMLAVGVGMLFTVIMLKRYGSVSAGITSLSEAYKANIMMLAESMGAAEGSNMDLAVNMLYSFGDRMFMFVPTASFAIALAAAWFTKIFLAILSRVCGNYRYFFGVPSRIPSALGAAFVLLLIAEVFGTVGDSAFSYVIINIRYIIMLLLAGEGIKAYILSLSLSHTDNMARIMLRILAGIAAVIFFPTFVPMIAAYYAAYLSIFGKLVRNSPKN